MNKYKEINCFLKKRTFFFRKKIFNSNRTFQKNVIWFIILIKNNKIGIGECNPILDKYALKNLKKFEIELENIYKKIIFLKKTEIYYYYKYISYSSILFGLEQAFLSLKNEFPILYHSEFTHGNEGIPTNNLMWLNSFNKTKYAIKEIENQIMKGFSFIKMKINKELIENQFIVLNKIKKIYPSIKIRVDANGCFENIQMALYYLNKFYDLDIIDFIEQPILPGNWKYMSEICEKSKLPIALDEELENVNILKKKKRLLDIISPQYIVLKPSINNGFYGSEEWILEAEKRKIKWYISSSLESNIGINAIAQWTFMMQNKYSHKNFFNAHGLNTGILYINNWISSLEIKKGFIWFNPFTKWRIETLLN
ncbi:enolase C-terminal domain-like protein [Blattabacterium sp. (Blaberus giganteus)]|uniref:enolase C-terminal domain-like protein n=1 Tax=Blattabacterium sp. (Blaberus giganteus) TaxID=1186051 RepID=UPI00025F6F68|nr:enolase C-terminal domain-like protein [Blattabacterium sp. (Blaberus giganteus)]AFJ90795.1 chloromuconate cycloisomerase [Blattabacterium sp. (Blaberus giganteus)]